MFDTWVIATRLSNALATLASLNIYGANNILRRFEKTTFSTLFSGVILISQTSFSISSKIITRIILLR